MIHLKTARLEFRQWQESDFESFAKSFADERPARFVGGLKTPEEAWRLMAASQINNSTNKPTNPTSLGKI